MISSPLSSDAGDKAPADLFIASPAKVMSDIREDELPRGLRKVEGEREALPIGKPAH